MSDKLKVSNEQTDEQESAACTETSENITSGTSPESDLQTADMQEDSGYDVPEEPQEDKPGDTVGAAAVKPKSFRQRIDDLETLVAGFIAENNIMARFIGLFLIFSSGVFIGNYRREPRTEKFRVEWGDRVESRDWTDYSDSVSFGKMAFFIVLVFAAVSLLRHFLPKLRKINLDGYILVTGVMMFGICALWRNNSDYFYLAFAFGIIAVSLILLAAFLKAEDFGELKKVPNTVLIPVMGACAAGVALFVAMTTIFKHKVYFTAVYDLGIFTQMYHSIITDFTQNTTCERGYVLSHFAVHFSPIYYVLAPVYMLFPSAETLLASQAVLAVSGFIPLYLICRRRNFSDIMSFMFTLVYIFSASVTSPCYYEFHENAFLPPLLMWFFYAIEKNSTVMMYITMVLVLMVKEDAALYVMCIALYLVFSGRSRKHGIVMFLATAALFVNVLSLMSKYGEGAMTNRTFGNLMKNYDGGFGEVIKTALTNPMYFIQQCFANDGLEKLVFIIVMLLPLLFMPFITKKASVLLLVVPFIIMNLASGYAYASKFDYQYVFGTTACLIYAALVNVSEFDAKTRRTVIPLMAVASVLMFTACDINKLYYADVYDRYKEVNERKASILAAVPEDGSVLATPFLIPHLANRDELYILDEGTSVNEDTSDFVVFEDHQDEWILKKREMLESEGYTVYKEAEGVIVIYVSPEYEIK